MTPVASANVRYTQSSSSTNQSEIQKSEPNPEERGEAHVQLIEEEEVVLSRFTRQDLLPEVPIKSLGLSQKITKVEKKGSFSVDIFKGSYDEEFLVYPDTLENRNENIQLKEQALMVAQMYPQIWDDNKQLQRYNFFNLFQLSVTEMMTIFEAVGLASRKCYSSIPTTQNQQYSAPHQTQVAQAIISLVIRNCLTYWPIFKSNNPKAKELLPQKDILFGGSVDAPNLYLPIGFAWTEQAANLGSLPPQEWLTVGESGGPDVNHLLISGRKTRILYDETIENYLVYYRDKFLSDTYEQETPPDEPNPASDPFVGACILHKSQVRESPVYYDSAGCKYLDIQFDTLTDMNNQVFPAARMDTTGVNVKALGQLATCSVVLGILKDSLKMTYKHLLDNKRGILNCDIIERKLATVTAKIFAIESMVYYISGMYDGLKDGFDAHMESTICKIVTNEYAYDCLRDLQLICGSDMFIVSKIQDQVNIFDAFLDGNIYNRLYLSTMGILWFARSKNAHLNHLRLAPWYPGYFVKSMIREISERRDYLTINADIYGYVHPSLKDAATNLEYILKRVKYATESLIHRHGKDVTGAQSSLYVLSQLSIDSFLLTTMCSRASKSYCNGSKNADVDVAIATGFSRNLARDVRAYMEQINIIPMDAFHNYAKTVNEQNLKMGGYYAESPLDPNL